MEDEREQRMPTATVDPRRCPMNRLMPCLTVILLMPIITMAADRFNPVDWGPAYVPGMEKGPPKTKDWTGGIQNAEIFMTNQEFAQEYAKRACAVRGFNNPEVAFSLLSDRTGKTRGVVMADLHTGVCTWLGNTTEKWKEQNSQDIKPCWSMTGEQTAFATEHYLDRSIPAHERIAEQQQKVHQELQEPSPTRQGFGGVITHEYLLAQSISAFERIVKYYDETQKTWMNDPVALAELKVTMVKETDPTAKDIMKVALAMVGEKAYEADLLRIVRRDDQPTIRQYAIWALGNSKAMNAIPDLEVLLKDPYEIPAGCVKMDGAKTVYPIREAAAFALRQLGVKVKEVQHGQYDVDQQSLGEAIGKTRKQPAEKDASQAAAGTQSVDR